MSPSSAHETSPPGGAERLLSADIQESVERFSDPALMAAGKVNIIFRRSSAAAVRQPMGNCARTRWSTSPTACWERGVGTLGAYLRVSDTDFFVVHPDLGPGGRTGGLPCATCARC